MGCPRLRDRDSCPFLKRSPPHAPISARTCKGSGKRASADHDLATSRGSRFLPRKHVGHNYATRILMIAMPFLDLRFASWQVSPSAGPTDEWLHVFSNFLFRHSISLNMSHQEKRLDQARKPKAGRDRGRQKEPALLVHSCIGAPTAGYHTCRIQRFASASCCRLVRCEACFGAPAALSNRGCDAHRHRPDDTPQRHAAAARPAMRPRESLGGVFVCEQARGWRPAYLRICWSVRDGLEVGLSDCSRRHSGRQRPWGLMSTVHIETDGSNTSSVHLRGCAKDDGHRCRQGGPGLPCARGRSRYWRTSRSLHLAATPSSSRWHWPRASA